jgi:hypothetical protein
MMVIHVLTRADLIVLDILAVNIAGMLLRTITWTSGGCSTSILGAGRRQESFWSESHAAVDHAAAA